MRPCSKVWARWVHVEGYTGAHPLPQFKTGRAEDPVVQPFTADQVETILFAAVRRRVGPTLLARDVASSTCCSIPEYGGPSVLVHPRRCASKAVWGRVANS